MSTLTKILVVVMVVAAIFASLVFINYANVVYNYKRAFEEQKSRADAADVTARDQILQKQAVQTERDKTVQAKDDRISALQSANEQQQAQLTAALADKAQQANTVESLKASVAGLNASLEKQTAMQDLLQTQLADARKTLQTLNDQYRQLEQANNDLTLNYEQTTMALRVLREQAAEKDRKISQLESAVAKSGGKVESSAPAQVSTGQKIEATVDAVKGNLASINVGSADGVTQGSKFILYRGSEYVGDLSIAQVDVNSSAGTLSNLQRTPQQGDKATTSLK